MCGIVGILDPHETQWPERPFDLDIMRHRGPDDRGVWTGPGLALGQVRLAILDLSPAGHQPFLSDDGRHVLVFNGEIYNYIELRAELESAGCQFRTGSDTEVLLKALLTWGEAALPRLWGMFAFALWDTREQRLCLARDRFGEKPLYLHRSGQRLIFSSELKMLLSILPEKPELDPVSLDRYLHHGYIAEPASMLQGIEKLSPGTLLTVSRDKPVSIRRWWGFTYAPESGDPVERLDAALQGAVRRCLRADVPVGISLSGGLDSSAVAVLAHRQHSREVRAITIGYPGELENDESAYARSLAQELGMPFERVIISPDDCLNGFSRMIRAMDEPVGDVAAFAIHQVARAAREQGTPVLLSGLGGDELFWGYPWVQQATRLCLEKRARQSDAAWSRALAQFGGTMADWKLLRQLMRNHSTPAPIKAWISRLRAAGMLHLDEPRRYPFDALQGYFPETARLSPGLYTKDFSARLNPTDRLLGCGLDTVETEDLPAAVLRTLYGGWLAGNCLLQGDRLSMDWSVELRLPLLEGGLVETVATLPPLQTGYDDEPKGLLKKVLRRHLPAEVIDRPKRGFSPPAVDWTRRLYDTHGAELPEGRLVAAGVFRADALRGLLEGARRSDRNLNLIYRLLVLEFWMKEVLG